MDELKVALNYFCYMFFFLNLIFTTILTLCH